MKTGILACLIMILGSNDAFASSRLKEQKVNLKLKEVSLKECLSAIEAQSNMVFVYNESTLDINQLVSVNAKNESVEEVLNEVLENANFKVYDNQVVIVAEEAKVTAVAQPEKVKVSGTVVDQFGMGIPGVNVTVKGTTVGTITNLDGQFSLEVSANSVIVYSFIGFATQEVVVAEGSSYNVTLLEDVMNMDEVVVTALGIKREKKALGYSVAEVGDEAFETAKPSNAMSALSGRLSGVQVSSTAQGPGSSTSVIIRGTAIADGSNEPLYVVDGVPISNTQFSNGDSKDHGGIDSGNGMSGIAADDIENISVLKGAAATALYGSRAINGVVMITTKSGKGAEGTTIDFVSTTTIDQARIYTDWQDVYGQGTFGNMPTNQQEAKDNTAMWGAKYNGQKYTNYRGDEREYKFYDNENNFYDLGVTLSNNIAVNHNTETSTMRMSYSNLNNTGMVPNTSYDRNIITLNGNTKAWDGKLELTAKLSYINEESSNQMIGASPFSVSLVGVPNNVPLDDLKDYKDAETGLPVGFGNRDSNIYWSLNEIKHKYEKERVLSMGQAKYNFNDNLSAMVRYGNDLTIFKNNSLWPIGTPYYTRGRVMLGNSRDTETNIDGLLTFNKDFDGWGMTVNGGAATMVKEFDQINTFEENFTDPAMQRVGFGADRTIEPNYAKKKINSVFGTAQFRYGTYLYLDFSARNDWSSTLPEDNNSYFYPSVSSSFVFSELINMPSWFTFGKFRASWAEVGSDTDPYMLALNYKINSNKIPGYGGDAANGHIDGGTIPNKELKPSMNESVELGVDLKFFNNRLGLDAAWYRSRANNQIVKVSTSATSGFHNAIINAGAIQNAGVEISLYADPIRTADFSWNTRLNYAYNKNEVLSLTEGVPQLSLFETSSVNIVARPGEAYGQIMGYKYMRNEDGTIALDENSRPRRTDERHVLGNAYHKTMLGWINSFSYKNWRATFVLDGKFGGELYSSTEASAYSNGKHKATLQRDQYTEGEVWYPAELEGLGTTSTPMELFGEIASINEQFIYDASYLAVQEINLNYSFPAKMFEKVNFMRGASVGVFARNLGYVWKATDNIDPQATFSIANGGAGVERGSLSLPRNFGFNLNIKF
ncbi:SusC/RagA family TonB-linked outer membrane protein [Carboxylicivirga sp. A043]|uniref:SusC/RagA family TonB-linked outer membrane protein n=1 Tax=Carboxylicivirga litoralis TaxID=2816963 RepID=UPI0021CB9434|nr:SusC/RagA family TonB-linked outer membrane protein [Carboxylicivirga sp. A043]MCU4156366.1 SusC/RagA family TonB-linked outer membrane protein [Carboxylicivirga sp. A043]